MAFEINAAAFRDWTKSCVAALSKARAEIDAMNVFPVADCDTGTNAYFTFVSGAEAVAELPSDTPLSDLVNAYLRGLLVGAKGNSGVIMSQLVMACFRDLNIQSSITAGDVAESFAAASRAAYAAVGDPVEGTILSVAKAAAEGAASATSDDGRLAFAAAAAAAREALQATPAQLVRLANAGVVDAGGRVLVVILDVTEQALTGRLPAAVQPQVPVPIRNPGEDFVEGGPSYEVMYLLHAPDQAVPGLREALAPLGDSLVVVGGDGLWNVHVHVDDVGAAIEAGLAVGRPYRIAVTHFAEQLARRQPIRSSRVVFAATTGDGLESLCREAGAEALPFTRARGLSIADMITALRHADADEVIVLPNNQRYVGLFEAAAKQVRDDGIRIAVIPTHAQVQGLAALAVHDPGLDFDDDVVAMSSAAAHTQHGAVTVAQESAFTMAGPCHAGDALGVISGDFAIIGQDILAVAEQVLDILLSNSSELVTIVTGAGADPALAAALEKRLSVHRPDVDVLVYPGGQENYPLFIAVE